MFERDIEAGTAAFGSCAAIDWRVVQKAGIAIADLDAIAFGQGPGSFTGVRIACGLAQGMAYGAGLGMVPVETQMTMAEQCACDRVLVALDARMGEIYLAAYVRDSSQSTGWSRCRADAGAARSTSRVGR